VRRLLLSAGALRFLDSFILIGPLYTVMMTARGLGPAQLGVIMASWSLVGLLLEVPCGVLADRMSRPLLLALAQLARCGGLVVWIAFPTFWGFLAGLMLWGMKSATMNGAFEAVVYDELKLLAREHDYARIIGRMQSARFSGLLAASVVAAWVVRSGFTPVLWISVAIGIGASLSALFLPRAPRAAAVADWDYLGHLKQGVGEAAQRPGVARLLLFAAAIEGVVSGIADYWQMFARSVGLPASGIALFVGAMAAMGAAAAPLAHRLRRLPAPALGLLFAAAGLSVAIAAATFQPWSVVFPMAYVALFWTADINADARFQHSLRPETRATVASVKGVANQALSATLMLTFGVVAAAASYRVAFLGAGALAIAVGAGFALVLRNLPARSPP
jgi:MFS family permease